MCFKKVWNNMPAWKKGMTVGFIIYLPVALLALALYLGSNNEGAIGAMGLLMMASLPTSLLEILIERLDPSFNMQVVNFFVLAFVHYTLGGAAVGYVLGRLTAERTKKK